jgi:RES domain-containing protein
MIDEIAQPLRTTTWSCRSVKLPSETALDLISDRPNRWNAGGERTIYLSCDPALALLEAGRHPEDLVAGQILVEVEVDLPRVIDLRDLDVRAALGLPADNAWVLDRRRTRKLARSHRQAGDIHALIVPSAGALDQPDRWNVVVFADDVGRVARIVGRPQVAGRLILGRAGQLDAA